MSNIEITSNTTGFVVSSGVQAGVESGVTVNDTIVYGEANILVGAVSNATMVFAGGSEYVGGSIYEPITSGPDSGGQSAIDGTPANGEALGTVVGSGGLQNVFAGLAIGTTVDASGEVYVDAGTLSGGIIQPGGKDVDFSGHDVGTTVSAGAFQTISAFGSVSGTILYGNQHIEAGGVASGTMVQSGGFEYISGGSAVDSIVSAGGRQELVLATASGTTVESGGVQTVAGGQYELDNVYYTGSAAATMVESGGQEIVTATGTAVGTIVQSGAAVVVQASGTIVDPIVKAGGILLVVPGGTVSGAPSGSITSTGTVILPTSGAVLAAPSTVSAVISAQTNEFVLSGGTATGTSVSDFSQVIVYAGGSDISATLGEFGFEVISSGGTSLDTTVAGPFGEQEIASGGTATGMVATGGFVDVQSGGSATNVFVTISGDLIIAAGGTVDGAVVSAGGQVEIGSGTIITNLEVGSGAYELLDSGGILTDPVISSSTLELDSGAVVSGAITFAGTNGQLVIDASTVPTNTVSGFGVGDSIALANVSYAVTDTAIVTQPNVVQVVAGATTYDFAVAGATIGEMDFRVGDDDGLTLTKVACYCAGTLILTPRGEVAVETLAIGDLVVTVAGRAEPIRWLGRRAYAERFLRGRAHLLPVRIQRGALGSGLPRRDLLVSPSHAMLIDGLLVPAGELINGQTIVQEVAMARVDYTHIELARHDTIWAEGAASETFIDDDSRGLFHNANGYAELYGETVANGRFCAPRVTYGFALDLIRRRLATLARAAA